MSKIRNLKSNPFSKYSAEEELEILDDIYYQPRYYSELLDLLSSGVSRFILGQRGQGKSATIYKLFNDLSKNHTLPLLITRYDGIPLTKNENYLLYRIMQSLTIGIARHLFENKKAKKSLSKAQQQQLSFFIELFYEDHCANQFIESAKEIRSIKTKTAWSRFYNKNILSILNSIINGTVNVSSTWIRSSIGLDGADAQIVQREYLKEIEPKPITNYKMSEVASWDRERLLRMLNFLVETARPLGYESIVILFDKIDEFQEINSDVEKVTDFAIEILSDTDLLYSEKLSIVFSLWSEVKRSLNRRGIRFDKFKEVDIRWRTEEMEPLINCRLKAFSSDRNNPVTLDQLIPDENDRRTIIELCDHSPRALIRLLGEIYNEELKHDISKFSPSAIAKGMTSFCSKYDYESQQPSKTGKRSDLINWLNRCLRIRKPTFSIEDFNTTFSQKTGLSLKHVDAMSKLGIIKESYNRTHQGHAMFEIVDPKLKHLISRGILELDQ